MRPPLFIASSSESIEIAYAVQANLETDFEITIWHQGVIKPSSYPLDSLSSFINEVSYGVFILGKDDLALSRGEVNWIPRDNVIFELGLFVGRLGYPNAFLFVPRSVEKFKLPSDLQGLTLCTYDTDRRDGNTPAAITSACNSMREAIKKRPAKEAEEKTWQTRRINGFDSFTSSFPGYIGRSSSLSVLFVNSRRWRSNNYDSLVSFLEKQGNLEVYLPDLQNKPLIAALEGHFVEDELIRGMIADAYRYFLDLSLGYPKQIKIRLFQTFPTYSFYKFDDLAIVAMYPFTRQRRNVPSFEIALSGPFGNFLKAELTLLEKESPIATEDVLLAQIKSATKGIDASAS